MKEDFMRFICPSEEELNAAFPVFEEIKVISFGGQRIVYKVKEKDCYYVLKLIPLLGTVDQL